MKRKWTYGVGFLLLALVFAVSGASVLRQMYQRNAAAQSYEEAAGLALGEQAAAPVAEEKETAKETKPPEFAELPEPPLPLHERAEENIPQQLPEELQFLLEVDLDVLRETNEDVIGWIYLPDSVISYPLMRSEDNNEYLDLTWDLTYSRSGSIFLERRSSPDLSDFHTLIYGHNWKDGRMFSELTGYGDQEYADSHPRVYIVTDDVVLRYEVFSAYTADVVSDTYRLVFEDEARKQSVIDFYLEQSEIQCDLIPTTEDQILTLSTCTGLGIDGIRWVVHTVLTGEFSR